MKKYLVFITMVLIIVVGMSLWYANNKGKKDNKNPSVLPSLITKVSYICKDDKAIEASFYKGELKLVAPGEMPKPNGSVKIVLSDGRKLDLIQTISADGSRYVNADESFVFWSKGNGALVLENNIEKSYIGCIILTKDTGKLPKFYLDSGVGFSIRYPKDYVLNTSYKYQALGPGKDISGVKFIIPASLVKNTNLSSFDTGVSIESISAIKDCNAGFFVGDNTNTKLVNDNGIDYSFVETSEGAAGNRYEEQVWAIVGTNPCIAVRYFIHSSNIGNYPKGKVVEFDRAGLIKQFDEIRKSLTVQ